MFVHVQGQINDLFHFFKMSFSSVDEQSQSKIIDDFEDMDPTITVLGLVKRFDKEIRIKFIYENEDSKYEEEDTEEEERELRIVRFRIFEKIENQHLEYVRLEIEDDQNVSFFIESQIDENLFNELQNANRLRIGFDEITKSIIDLLEKSVKQENNYKIVFRQDKDFGGTLTFLQSLKLRNVTIFSLNFRIASSEFIRLQVQYRFNKVKHNLRKRETEIEEQFSNIKKKSPTQEKYLRDTVTKELIKKNLILD